MLSLGFVSCFVNILFYSWNAIQHYHISTSIIWRRRSNVCNSVKNVYPVLSYLFYTRMLRSILNKSWRQNATRHQLYGHLPPITKTIQVRRTRHAEHYWRSKDELRSDELLWTPSYGRSKAGRPARTYLQQLCEDSGFSPEHLPEAMNDREKWRERVRDIRPGCTTGWWSSSYLILEILHKHSHTKTHTHTLVSVLTNTHRHIQMYVEIMYIYIYIYRPIGIIVLYRPMVRVFASGRRDRSTIIRRVIPKTQKWYLIPPCLILSIIRYISRVSGSILGKVVHLGVVATEKGAFS